jgi:predicted MPP superfamily phosphohydrolase
MEFYLIFAVILVIYGGLNYSIGVWLWNHLFSKLPLFSYKGYLFIFSLLVAVSLIGVIWNRALPGFLQDVLYFIASYWLLAVMYFSLLIVLVKLIMLLNRWLGLIPARIIDSSLIGLLVVVTVVALFVYGTINAGTIRVTEYSLNIPKQAGELEELQIAFLSDLHLSDFTDSRLKEVVETINQLDPDLVLLAGDIIDSNRGTQPTDVKEMQSYFQKIRSKYGTFASLGNHDYDHWSGTAERVERFQEAGVTVLRDTGMKIADSFYLIGREDISYERRGRSRQTLSTLMQGIEQELPVIVLDHQPVNIAEPKEAGVDLQLSGHTHHGQVFPVNLFTNKLFEVDYGYLQKDQLQVIVSSGARTWGPPMRIGSRCEVVHLTVSFRME